jgi:hypothetical protein
MFLYIFFSHRFHRFSRVLEQKIVDNNSYIIVYLEEKTNDG